MKDSKWTIYNNTMTWEQLSDKKKGKFLLADHNQTIMKKTAIKHSSNQDMFIYCEKIDHSKTTVYRAAPAPTMEELFAVDWHKTNAHLLKDFSKHMIAKGWKK